MNIDSRLYDTRTLMGLMEHVELVNSYFTDLGFGATVLSDKKYIDFEKLDSERVIAPLVVPLADGKPIYERTTKVHRYTPAYVKMLDMVEPQDLIYKLPGELATPAELNPMQRMTQLVVRIGAKHREALARRIEKMASDSIRFGQMTLVDEQYPEGEIIDFERDPSHTVVLTGPNAWGLPTSTPIANINSWAKIMTKAKHGGQPNRLTMGADAYDAFIKDPEVQRTLDLTLRGSQGNFNIGLSDQGDVQYKGRIGSYDIYVYSGYYEEKDPLNPGATIQIPYLASNEVILTAPGMLGVKAFGAIIHNKSLRPETQFFNMYDTPNGGQRTALESHSSPLTILVNPNRTFRAVVL